PGAPGERLVGRSEEDAGQAGHDHEAPGAEHLPRGPHPVGRSVTRRVPMQTNGTQAPGFAVLLELIMGSMVTQAVYVAARLDIAGILGDGPLAVEEIARRVDADADATYRLLRALAGHSVFAERADGRF